MTTYQTRNKRIGLDERITNFVGASVECGFAGQSSLTREQLYMICDKTGIVYPRWLAKNADRRLGRGVYSFPELAIAVVSPVIDDISLSTSDAVAPGHGTDGDDLSDQMIELDELDTTEAVCQTIQ
jgi:hypothetical protein